MNSIVARRNVDPKGITLHGQPSRWKAAASSRTQPPRGWCAALAAAAIAAVCLAPMQAEAAYSGSGTFNLITSTANIGSGGYYVFVGGGTVNAMASSAVSSATVATAALGHETIAITASAIVNPGVGIVWKIDAVSSSMSIYNEAGSRYIGNAGANNGIARSATNSTTVYHWSFAATVSSFTIRNIGSTDRMLRWNTGTPRFAAYSTGQTPIQLFRLLAAEPATHASSLSFTQVGSGQMTINWANGSGAYRLVVVRSGSATSWTPTDWTTYSSGVNSNYTSATDLGSGNKICYNGSATNFTLTGLTPATTYYVTIFEYNGDAAAENYYTGGTPLNGNQATATEHRMALYDRVRPLATYFLGDYMSTNYEFAINVDTTGYTIQYGIGTTTTGSGWTWNNATWSRMDGANNRVWKANSSEYRFTGTGTYYYAGKFITGGYTYFSDGDWTTNGAVLNATNYFTVNAINDPGSQTATANGSSQIDLTWAKNAQSHNVMIVRSADSSFTDPTQGTTYAVNDTIGGDTVIYNGSGTSTSDTGRSPSTTYYYKFYSVNNNYYSAGVTANATTTASTPSITIADNGTVGAANVVTGTTAQVLVKFSVAVTTANATLTNINFTTAGTYDANDLTNLKLRYSTDSTLDAGDATLSTINTPAAAGAKSFATLSQAINSGSTGYFFITADVAGSADYGHTVNISAIANADVQFAAGSKSGSASAGGAQTFIASAPTANGTLGAFAAVGTYQMEVNWTSGNGERRIVVVRSGSATSWTPSDGTAPSGVNTNFTSATDQGSGNKICYDGTGTSFTLTGLSASTTYYVTIFEYNGTGSYVKYYTAGAEASGSQATQAAGAPGSITTQPDATYAACAGASVNMTVTASGSAPIQYAWRKRSAGWGNSWSITTGNGGVFIGNNQSSIDTSSKAWGMWNDGPALTEAKRDFTALPTGSVFYVEMDNAGVGSLSSVGFSLQNSSGTSGLEFYFQGGDSNYTINRNGGEQDSGIGWTANGLLITLTNVTTTTYSMMITVKGGSTYGPFTGTYLNGVSSISRFRAFYYEDSSDHSGGDLFFNNLKVGPFLTCPLYDDTAAAYSSWSGNYGQGPLTNGATGNGSTNYNVATDTLTISNLVSADAGTYDVVVYNAFGGATSISTNAVLSVNALPTITLGSSPSIYRGTTSANLSYSGTTGNPNQYRIDYDGTAEAAGFADVAYTSLAGSPISLTVPAGAAAAAYNGTIYVRNSTTNCDSTGTAFTVTISAVNDPSGQTATRNGASPTSQIDLSWSKNAQANDVLVVRKLASDSWTEPTQGVSYTNADTIGLGTVVYKGGATSANATGLTADRFYDFKFYSVNNNYYSAGVTSAPASTLAAEPGASPSALTFSAVGTNGMTIGWSGTSTQVLVAVRAGSDLGADPTDGAQYTANSTYGSGTAMGSGYIVYRGNGTSVTITNLAVDTVYYVRVFNFNGGAGTENYRTSDELAGSQATQAIEPAASPSALAFSAVGTNGMTIGWSGTSTQVLVAVRATSDLSADPTDGTQYTASATYGSGSTLDSGYVVYRGNGTSVTITNLAADTVYYVRVFNFNGGAGSENYRTSDELAGSQSTLAVEPAASPTTLSFSGVDQTVMTINWAAVSTQVLVVVRATSDLSAEPADGSQYSADAAYGSGTALGGGYVVYRGSGTSVNLTGLTAGTLYYVHVFNFNGGAGTENYRISDELTGMATTCSTAPGSVWANPTNSVDFTANWSAAAGATNYYIDVSTSATFQISGGAAGSIYTADFEDSAKSSYATGTITNNGIIWTFNEAVVGTTAGSDRFNGSKSARVRSNETVNSSGIISMNSDTNMGLSSITLYYAKYGTDANTDGRVEWSTNSGTSWSTAGTFTASSTTLTLFEATNINVSGNVRVRVVKTSGTTTRYNVDDIKLYPYSSAAPDFVPGYSNRLAGAGTSISVTGLTGNVTYYFRVRSQGDYCISTNSGMVSVTTVASVPYIALADNGTQVAAGNIPAGSTTNVLHKFQLTVTNTAATLTGVSFTSAGTYGAADVANFKVYYSADNTLEPGSDTLLGTISTSLGAGAHSLSSLTQGIAKDATGYVFITVDLASTAAAGKTINVSAVATGDLTFSSGSKSGSTTAGGAQTITSAVTIDNTGAPGAGYLAAGTSDAVLFGFRITPATGSIDFTALSLTTAGTATSSDLNSFRVVYDADGSGTYNGGDSVVSDTNALGAPIAFTMYGQTGISAARRYLVIANVAASPTAGRTITCSIGAAGDVTTTGTESGTAAGNSQTIITVPTLTTPTATAIDQTGATLGATISATGGVAITQRGTVWGTSASPTGNLLAEGGTAAGAFTQARSGLSQGTKYYYRGYASNAVGLAYSPDGSFYTEPGEAASVVISGVSPSGMTVSWTGGADSDGAIVVMRAANATVSDPTDGTLHSASATFGSGADLGSSSYVVYRGAGTSVTVTNLAAATTYYVEVFAYKGTVADSGVDQGINYRQTSPATGNQATMAAEPTVHASSLLFTGVSDTQMTISWANGNGASRIVVVRQGSATSWTPSDGTAPSGVSTNFSIATDQGSGNKICYNGTATNFTLTGLTGDTTYYVTVFEYNGSGTGVNYYVGGTPLSGSQMTASPTCVPGEVALTQQATYYTKFTDGGDIFDSGTTNLGMWAHGGNKQVVAWRSFKTSGTTGGGPRELQPGDRFRVSVRGYSPYGILGVSLNDGAGTGSWANRTNNTRGYIECGNGYGDLYVTSQAGASSWSGIKPWAYSTILTLEYYVLSSKEFTANIVGQTPKYDLSMIGSPADTDHIDGYSLYYFDDWADGAERDAFWSQDTTVTNLGYVTFGADNGTRTIYGKITDGLNAKCTNLVSPNRLIKSGSGTVTLNNTNTYTLDTEIAGGTLQVYTDSALGTAPGSVSNAHIKVTTSGAALVAADSFTLNANRGITLSGWMYWGVADNKTNTYNGVVTDGGSSYDIVKNQGGELVLGGANTFDSGVYIDNGTLTLNHANAAGTDGIFIGQDSGSYSATLKLASAITVANNLTIRTESTGVKYIKATETATLSGAITNNETDDDRFTVDVASGKTLTLGGTMSGTGGGELTKTGAGTLVMSGTNTHDKKVTVEGGTVSIAASRNLGEDPAGAYASKITLNGGTLQVNASFTLNPYYSTTLGANNGILEVTDGYVLTNPAPISGSGALGKTGTGTLILTGANTFSGKMTNSAGTVQIGNNGTSGSISADLENNSTLIWYRSDDLSYSGAISGTGTLTKNGAGTLTLSGTCSYSGSTTVGAGTLLVSGSAANSAVSVSSGATLMGDGPVGNLTVTGTVDPGNAAAGRTNLACGTLTLNDTGAMRVDIAAATGTAGTDWDLITASGAITANASGTFTLNLYGTPTGFNSAVGYSWKIMGGASVANFAAGRFAINTNNFLAAQDGGSFSVSQSGNDIYLNFSPRTPAAPTSLVITQTNAASLQLTFALNANSDPVVIVYDTDGTFSTPSGSIPAVGNAFAGGFVVYSGSASPQTHSGLTACSPYYYKAWSYNGTNYSATGVTDNDSTISPSAPTNVWASETNNTSFNAAWLSAAGATNYYLDVSTNATFGGTGSSSLSTILFQGFEGTGSDTWTISSGGGLVSSVADGGTDSPASGRIRTGSYSWQSSNGTNSLDLANLTIAGYSTRTVEVRIASIATNGANNGADAGDNVKIFVATNGAAFPGTADITIAGNNNARWAYAATNVVLATAGVPVSVSAPQAGGPNVTNYATARILIPDGGTSLAIRVTAANNDLKEVWAIDDIKVEGVSAATTPNFVAGYSNRLVGAVTDVAVTGLTENIMYYFRVRAEGAGAGCISGNSPTGNVLTLSSLPSAPTGLTASDGSSTVHVALSWNDVGTETGYVIWRHTANVFGSSTAIYTNAADVTTYNDTSASEGQLYYYWVTATNAAGTSAASTSDSGYRALSPPANVAATDGTSLDNVTITWDAATGATAYKIFRDTDSDPTGATELGVQASGYADTSATAGQLYYYWVVASNSTSLSQSTFSTADTGYRKLATVTGVTASYDLYNDRIEVQWTDGAGETGYSIWRYTADDTNSVVFIGTAAANATNYSDTSAAAGVNLYYWVRATNNTSASQSDLQANGALGRRLDPNLPVVTTDDPSEITQSSAKGGGNVTDGGGAAVTDRGVVWSTSLNPTTADNKSQSGTGTGAFTNFISGLIAGQSYYVRAYASNSYGVTYGSNKGLTNSCFTNAPAGLFANPTNFTDFTANWTALGGAATYRIDVSTISNFGGQASLGVQGFEGTGSDNWGFSTNSGTVTVVTTTNRTGTHALQFNGTGCVTFSPIALSGTGASTVTVAFASVGADANDDLYISICTYEGGVLTTNATELIDGYSNANIEFGETNAANPTTVSPNPYSIAVSATATQVYVKVYGLGLSSGEYFYIDDLSLTGPAGSYVSGYQDRQVSSGASVSVTGLTEDVTYYYRVRAESPYCTGGNSTTGSVTTRISALMPPAAFSATAVGPTEIDLAFATNAAQNNIVIVYNTTGSFDSPVGDPPALGNAFAGGTLIYNGTGSSYPHTGLASCSSYYYRAWSYLAAGSMWSTASNATATTATPSPPASVYASVTNYSDFTAAWSAAGGAAGYHIDVSETADFGGVAGSSTRSVLASNAAAGPGSISGDWSGYALGGTTYVQMTNALAVITSAVFSTEGYTNLTVDFKARSYGTVSGTTKTNITVSISTNNGVDWTVMGVVAPASTTMTALPTLTNTANLGFAQTRIRWQTLTAGSGAGVGVTNLVVQGWSGGGGTPAYVPGYSNLAVGATSVSVTGLTEGATYYFRVRTTGDGGCASGNSTTGSVTTISGSPSQPSGLSASDGTSTAHVALTWNDTAIETGYVIWRYTLNQPASATAIWTNAADDTTYDDDTATPGELYYYWVSATNGIGSSAKSQVDAGFRRLSPPTAVSASDGISTNYIEVTWTAADGATSYKIFRDTDSDPAGAADLGTQNSGFQGTTAIPGQLYYYWVMAASAPDMTTIAHALVTAGCGLTTCKEPPTTSTHNAITAALV